MKHNLILKILINHKINHKNLLLHIKRIFNVLMHLEFLCLSRSFLQYAEEHTLFLLVYDYTISMCKLLCPAIWWCNAYIIILDLKENSNKIPKEINMVILITEFFLYCSILELITHFIMFQTWCVHAWLLCTIMHNSINISLSKENKSISIAFFYDNAHLKWCKIHSKE